MTSERQIPEPVEGCIEIFDHSFILCDEEIPYKPVLVTGNGLVDVYQSGMYVSTGTDDGRVSIRVEFHESEPPPDFDSWDEVVDVSFTVRQRLVFMVMFSDIEEDLPNLAYRGPGDYRLRFCARGRDEAGEYLVDSWEEEPVEQHAILVWPASTSIPIFHKYTDDFGGQRRRYQGMES